MAESMSGPTVYLPMWMVVLVLKSTGIDFRLFPKINFL